MLQGSGERLLSVTFFSNEFCTGDFYTLEEGSVLASKGISAVDSVPSSITLPTVPVVFYDDVERTFLEDIWREHDKYGSNGDGSGKAGDIGMRKG